MITEKHCTVKVLLTIWEIFLHINNCNYNSFNFNYKFSFILFFEKSKTRIKFSASWQSCNKKYLFFVYSESLYFKAMPNSRLLFLFVLYTFSWFPPVLKNPGIWLKFWKSPGKVLEFFCGQTVQKRDFLVNTSIFRAFSLCWIY